MPSDPRDTPAMRQHALFKKRHPGCVLLFRIGDFYEVFDDDAVTLHKALGLTLTQRTAGIPMAGVPFHQLDAYLRRLVDQGFRVAICEQTQAAEDVKTGTVIERQVTRVITPGTLIDEPLLADDRSNVLAAVCFPVFEDAPSNRLGELSELAALAIVEPSTGAFAVARCPAASVADELARRRVCEVIYPETADGKPPLRLSNALAGLTIPATPAPQWHFRMAEARDVLFEQFGVSTLAGFGLGDDDPLVTAAGAIVRYLRATQAPQDAAAAGGNGSSPGAVRSSRGAGSLAHLRPPRVDAEAGHLLIDAASLRALEIDRTIRAGAAGGGNPPGGDGSLAGVFTAPGSSRSLCRTPMGKRLLRDWLCRPAADLVTIHARQSCVATLVEDRRTAGELASALAFVQDVARIAGRVALRRATPRDVCALSRSLKQIAALAALLGPAPAFARLAGEIAATRAALEPLAARIEGCCVDEPPAHLREGGLIRDGFDAALDEARQLRDHAAQWLADYQARLVAEHNIPTLKVGYNKIFGYYIELSKGQSSRAPASFARRQTLTGAERFITPELKDFEDKITTARGRAVEREQELFDGLCAAAAGLLADIARFAEAVGEIDVLLALADKAAHRGWVRPSVIDEPVLCVRGGRHPVLDELLGANFVPNDVELGRRAPAACGPGENTSSDAAEAPPGGPSPTSPGPAGALALITGPNMAGKSTFIRQSALLVLLAHVGSFVPAESATIGLTDRIFTRVGADDALFAGQSTFMVEMTETASILHHATHRSLVILDEIGRGTSTLDGLSLAWAIAETLAEGRRPAGDRTLKLAADGPASFAPRVLFATHYHELTRLEELMPGRVINLHVAVREWEDQIIFLHRIVPGRADRSYGIHVAQLAGIPPRTIARAREILDSLSVEHQGLAVGGGGTPTSAGTAGMSNVSRAAPPDGQLSLFTEYVPHPAVNALREVKLDSLTPLEAFDELRRLQALSKAETQGAKKERAKKGT